MLTKKNCVCKTGVYFFLYIYYFYFIFLFQAQLHRMAVSGVQFSEHQLNAMYQQQMLTQQTYRQWVISLPAEQQMHLQQRMQASMQQVQLQMAQIIQHYSIAAAEVY